MLESIDLSATMSKETYRSRKGELIEKLVILQQRAISAQLPSIIVFDGWDAAGKGSCISSIVSELDPRHFMVQTIGPVTEDEKRLPFMEPFWRKVGMHGKMTIFNNSWYDRAFTQLVSHAENGDKKNGKKEIAAALDQKANYYGGDKAGEKAALVATMASFEKQFADDGYLVVKFFLHITKEEQERRLEQLADDEDTAWRVTKADWKQNRKYDKYLKIVDAVLTKTSYEYAPWYIVPAMDERVARIMVLQTLVDAFTEALEEREAASEGAARQSPVDAGMLTSSFPLVSVPMLDDVTYDHKLDEETYSRELDIEQDKLAELALKLYRRRIPLVIAYEGWDAAGKGGSIKRVTRALDARDYRVIPSASPTVPEKLHPFLWRYWINLPRSGHVGIYDRSWYGRVLVERVEGFARPDEWMRAYEEINEFEWELSQWGAIIIKFWVDVSPDVQLERFHERQNDPLKQWKITDEDWRNREKAPQYRAAVNDMLRLTSTEYAPWTIIESDDKYFARVKALKIINERIRARLDED